MPEVEVKKGRTDVVAGKATLFPYVTHRICRSAKELKKEAEAQRERINWAEAILGIPSIWWKSKGQGIRVAVLDSGISQNHPDLKPAIVEQRDFTRSQGVEDENGHGSHCAGIIAARANDVGFVGVAPMSDLVVAKVLDANGSGDFENIAAAIDWAVSQKADIISMSLGGMGLHPALFTAVHQALSKGVIVICAAGNSGSLYQNSVSYPGRFGSVITIGSHDRNGNRSGFSSFGGEIDFLAPGSNIWSTYKDEGFAELSGTSMATPFVAGLAALILAHHRQAGQTGTPIHNNADMHEHLVRMATHPGWHDNQTGYGLMQPLTYFR